VSHKEMPVLCRICHCTRRASSTTAPSTAVLKRGWEAYRKISVRPKEALHVHMRGHSTLLVLGRGGQPGGTREHPLCMHVAQTSALSYARNIMLRRPVLPVWPVALAASKSQEETPCNPVRRPSPPSCWCRTNYTVVLRTWQ
jgi:hypothetical protein